MSRKQAKHLAMLCVGGYALFIGTRALLEEKVPVPSRRHALLLETGASAFVALPEKWKPFCPAINLHESVLDRIWLQHSLSPARLLPAGTTLEVVSAPPHRPKCVGPAVRLRKRQTVRPGAWVALDYYLTAGSEWEYTVAVASSASMAVLQMTGDGYAAWQKGNGHKKRWGMTATDLDPVQRKQDRPAGILGAHLVQDGKTALRKWRVEAEGRFFLVIVPVGEGGGWVSLDLDIHRTAHCHTSASRGDKGGRWLEMPGSAVGFIVRVPQRENQETRPVREFFRCRAVDETVDFLTAFSGHPPSSASLCK